MTTLNPFKETVADLKTHTYWMAFGLAAYTIWLLNKYGANLGLVDSKDPFFWTVVLVAAIMHISVGVIIKIRELTKADVVKPKYLLTDPKGIDKFLEEKNGGKDDNK